MKIQLICKKIGRMESVLIKKTIKNKLKKNLLVVYIWNEYRRIHGNREAKKITDKEFIISEYRRRTGNDLSLKNPIRFTEKLQWLKLFYRDDVMEKCSDKYTARFYVEEQGHKELLNDLIGVYDDVNEIDFDKLPNQFVLKVSHGSGWNIVCKDKTKLNWFMYKKIIKSWMKQNLYVYGREWNYKNLTPKIIIEKYIDSGDGQLTDYKIFCFNGNPEFVQVDRDRFQGHKRAFYSMEWEKLDFSTGYDTVDEQCPCELGKMKKLAAEFAERFSFVRVDFYNVGKEIYFGEFTYFPDCGFYKYDPDKWDYYWGRLLELPQENYNKELLAKIVN